MPRLLKVNLAPFFFSDVAHSLGSRLRFLGL